MNEDRRGEARARPGRALVVPGPNDPRWFILAFLLALVVYALSSPGFSRHLDQYSASFVSCVGLDAALIYFYKGLLLAPMSGLITSMGTLLLCDSPSVWPYALVGCLSILSKHFIRAEGRHIFNPNNFGIVAALLFFSGDVTVVAGRWGGTLSGMLAVACLGVLTAYRARRLDLSIAYMLSFTAGGILRSVLSGTPLVMKLAPMTGASFMLFTFYMITDPMTTPPSSRGRIAFGIALGAIDSLLRHLQIHNSPFYALFLLTGLMPALRSYQWSEPGIWKTRSIPLPGGQHRGEEGIKK